MTRIRPFAPNAEVAMRRTLEPLILKGSGTVKTLSTAFLADLENDWRNHGRQIFPVLREKYPQAYFAGLVNLARIIRWEVGPAGTFDKPRTRAEIADKLERRAGPQGRALFEALEAALEANLVAGQDAQFFPSQHAQGVREGGAFGVEYYCLNAH